MTRRVLWRDADVLTLDPDQPRAEALVSVGEELVFVGSLAEAQKAAGPEAQVQSLGGRTVVPGFNDNHLHLVIHGNQSFAPSLTGLTEAQIVAKVKAFADAHPDEAIVSGFGWDYATCPHPTKELLDAAFPDRPVILSQFGGHGSWVNSVTLAKMGIDRHNSPKEGRVLRDAQGEPTGVLLEVMGHPFAQGHFFKMFFNRKLREPRILKALDEYRRLGFTSVQDNSWFFPVVRTLNKLKRQGRLTVRVNCWAFGRVPPMVPLMRLARYDKTWLRLGPVKYFLDGTFTTRTAWMTQEYPGRPGETGMGFEPAWLEGVLEKLARQKRQGAFHCIGDKAAQVFLDVWERVVARHPDAVRLRMRLEHAQVVRPEDLPRLKALGVCISAQATALVSPEKDEEILGRDRALAAYPHRSFLEHGIPLGFGSDIPGELFCDPLRAMHQVCNREGPQRLDPLEALKAYTQGSAYLEFQEHRKGTLKAGFLADFTVLSGDPTRVERGQLKELKAERTVVGGKTVWDSHENDGIVS